MIKSLRLLQQFANQYVNKKEVSYTLDSTSIVNGPLRSMQKFLVILLTDIGSDPIRPWFGTKLNMLPQYNMTNRKELELFVRNECKSAISQFFSLQQDEATQNKQTRNDVIEGLEIVEINIDTSNHVSITFRFTPLKSDSITFNINL